jgi:hypothetical protein
METPKGYISIGQTIFIIVSVAIIALGHYWWTTTKAVKEAQKDEWCEVGQVMSDGTIIYQGKGETELVMLATVSGPKLMAKCE